MPRRKHPSKDERDFNDELAPTPEKIRQLVYSTPEIRSELRDEPFTYEDAARALLKVVPHLVNREDRRAWSIFVKRMNDAFWNDGNDTRQEMWEHEIMFRQLKRKKKGMALFQRADIPPSAKEEEESKPPDIFKAIKRSQRAYPADPTII